MRQKMFLLLGGAPTCNFVMRICGDGCKKEEVRFSGGEVDLN